MSLFINQNSKAIVLDRFDRKFNVINGVDTDKEHPLSYFENSRDKSYLGTPIFAPLEIKAGSYTDQDGNNIEFEGIFLDTVITNIAQSKNIVKTKINGRKGTVKEHISDGDYYIKFDLIISAPGTNIYPEQAVNRLIKILQAPIDLEVVSAPLNRYGIYNVVIDGFTNGQRSGFYNQAIFSIKAISEIPLELQKI